MIKLIKRNSILEEGKKKKKSKGAISRYVILRASLLEHFNFLLHLFFQLFLLDKNLVHKLMFTQNPKFPSMVTLASHKSEVHPLKQSVKKLSMTGQGHDTMQSINIKIKSLECYGFENFR